MLKQTLLLTGVAVLGLLPLAAHADTITDDGTTYSLTYTTPSAGVYDVSLTVDTTNYNDGHAADPNYLQSVALDLNNGSDVTSVSVLQDAGFITFYDKDHGINNAGCTAGGKGFFCIEYTSNSLGAPAGAAGDIYNFEFQVTGPVDLNLDGAVVEANYNYTTTSRAGVVTNHNGELASDPITLTPAPEPSSLMLLGTSVLGAAGMLSRRFKA